MRLLVALLLLSSPVWGAFTRRWNLTPATSQVVGGTHTGFAVLVDITHNDLKQTGGGGQVTNANGYDIAPSTDSTCATYDTDFQREMYDGSGGRIVMWWNVSLTQGNNYYLCAGNTAITTDVSAPTTTWNSAYLMRHGFGNGSSIPTADSTSNGNNISSLGGFAANSGGQIYGAAAQGGTTHIDMNGSPLDGLTAFTIDGWIYNPSTANDVAFFSDWDSQTVLWRFSFSNSFRLILKWADASTTDFDPYTATGHATNTWTKMSVTYDGTTVRVYTNGAQVATASVSGKTMKSHTSTNTQNLGGGGTGTESYWRGSLDEFRVSNVARSADWLATEFNAATPSTFWTTTGPDTLATNTRRRVQVSIQ